MATTPSPQSSPRRCALSEPRVVLDTQILLRGALAHTQSLTARIYDAWRDPRFILLVSDSILTEVEMVTARPEVLRKLRVTSREIRALVLRIRRHGVRIRPDVMIRMSRDPTDDKLVRLAPAKLAAVRTVAVQKSVRCEDLIERWTTDGLRRAQAVKG